MGTVVLNDALDLIVAKMVRHGVPEQEATVAAPIYLEGELWGKRTHGFRYIEGCLFQYDQAAARRQPMTIARQTAVSALVDGGFHFATFVHHSAMQHAISLAQDGGVAVVGVRNSGNSGLLGYYSQMATQEGLIGIAINSAIAAVVAPGGTAPLLSTNPITIGIPRLDDPPLILDMATSAGTYSQVMVAQRDKTPLPAGIAVDGAGRPTTDPFQAVDAGQHAHLLPFGGHKGFGLSLMIELLCSAGLGAPIGTQKLTPFFDPSYCTGLYFVFRPDLFVERREFDAQVTQLLTDLAASNAGNTLHFPGEASQRRKAQILSSGMLDLEEPTYAYLTSE
jgi:LDH2 family malate/lactate/ureidoglycolate dehydrogenase